jgi:DNA-binding CsgD family transcriptional regulator
VPARPDHRRRLIKRPRPGGPLAELTKYEHQVLGLMAEGRSNQGICDRLFLSLNTVEAHVKHSAAGALRS